MKASATIKKKKKDLPKKDKEQAKAKKLNECRCKGDTCDEDCTCDECKKKKSNKITERATILSYNQFINESTDFQDAYSPDNFNLEDEEDSDIQPLEGSDVETHTDDELSAANAGSGHDDFSDTEDEMMNDDSEMDSDNWNKGDEFGDSLEDEPSIPKRGASKIDKINNELMQVNAEIGRLLDEYKTTRDVATYKKNASPLLAKRTELQSKLDAAFNVGSGQSEDEFADLDMEDDPYTF